MKINLCWIFENEHVTFLRNIDDINVPLDKAILIKLALHHFTYHLKNSTLEIHNC